MHDHDFQVGHKCISSVAQFALIMHVEMKYWCGSFMLMKMEACLDKLIVHKERHIQNVTFGVWYILHCLYLSSPCCRWQHPVPSKYGDVIKNNDAQEYTSKEEEEELWKL